MVSTLNFRVEAHQFGDLWLAKNSAQLAEGSDLKGKARAVEEDWGVSLANEAVIWGTTKGLLFLWPLGYGTLTLPFLKLQFWLI